MGRPAVLQPVHLAARGPAAALQLTFDWRWTSCAGPPCGGQVSGLGGGRRALPPTPPLWAWASALSVLPSWPPSTTSLPASGLNPRPLGEARCRPHSLFCPPPLARPVWAPWTQVRRSDEAEGPLSVPPWASSPTEIKRDGWPFQIADGWGMGPEDIEGSWGLLPGVSGGAQ